MRTKQLFLRALGEKAFCRLWYGFSSLAFKGRIFVGLRPWLYRDPKLRAVYSDLISHRNDTRLDVTRFIALHLIMRRLESEAIPGEIAELGTYRGNSAAFLRRICDRHIRIFDTFSGFDPRDGAHLRQAPDFKDVKLAEVRRRIGEANTTYHPGYFPDTFADVPPDARFCLVHVDMDLYGPCKAALERFAPRVPRRGYMIVHDYNNPMWNRSDDGPRRAVDEFLNSNTEWLPFDLPDTYGSVVLRKIC